MITLISDNLTKTVVVLALAIFGFTAAIPLVHAQTYDEQLEQLQVLTERVQQLQAQINTPATEECLILTRNLYSGLSDEGRYGDISRLQEFLRDRGHFFYPEITGYYGLVTQRAVQSWQSAYGIVSYGTPWSTGYGVVGPMTRTAIFNDCQVTPITVPRVDEPTDEDPAEPIPDPADGDDSFDPDAAIAFIESMYNDDLGLLKECPECSRYWLWSDQLVGQLVLQDSSNSSAEKRLGRTIENEMNSYDAPMKSMWATLDEEYFENATFNGTRETQIGDSVVWYSNYDIGGELDCADYADVAFMKAIYLYKTGDEDGARECYNHGKNTWDGTGMKDTGNITGDYAVYKTALGLLAEELTGFSRIGIPDGYFDRFQSANGGITTDIKNGQPDGSQNIETTAAVLMALDPGIVGNFDFIEQEGSFRSAVIYEAETDLSHGFGRKSGNGWLAEVDDHSAGHMLYGPYADDWQGSAADVHFRVMTEDATPNNTPIVTIDVYDSTADEIVAIEEIQFNDFSAIDIYEEFTLSISLSGRDGHTFETRVYWHDTTDVLVDSVVVDFTE